jgi:hypothetical protein
VIAEEQLLLIIFGGSLSRVIDPIWLIRDLILISASLKVYEGIED